MKAHHTIKTGLAALALILSSSLANAQAFSNVVVFGDSLSDTGNVASVQPGAPERFTNGAVAVELIAGALGFALQPSLHLTGAFPTGTNYAVGGARATDEDGDPATPDINLPTQVGTYLLINGGQIDPNALYVVFIGGNDVRTARDARAEGGFASVKTSQRIIRDAVNAVEEQIRTLIAAGAQHLLVVNSGDIGAIPETDFRSLELLSQADSTKDKIIAKRLEKIGRVLSAIYNARLSYSVAEIVEETGANITEYDLFTFLDTSIENADALGLTNTTDACIFVFTQGGAPNPECAFNFDQYLFFDEIHPTAIIHQRAAGEILQLLVTQ